MPPSLFTVDVQPGKTSYVPTTQSRGPWSPKLLHGGAVAALLAHALAGSDPGVRPGEEMSGPGDSGNRPGGGGPGDRVAPEGPDRWFPSRFTAEFPRPLPMAPMSVETTVVRAGRKARVIDATLKSNETLVARATLQQIRVQTIPIPEDSPARQWPVAGIGGPETVPVKAPGGPSLAAAFHRSAVEHRSHDGLLDSPGPAQDWIRVVVDLLPGVALSPFERTVAAADFGNGVSASLPFDRYTFINADLSVNLFRLPVDDWVLLDARTVAGDEGTGLAESALYDRKGLLGHACQSLVVDARTPRDGHQP